MRGEVISSAVMPGFQPQPGMHGMMMGNPPGMMMPPGAQPNLAQTTAGDDLGKRGRESGELLPAEEFLQQFPGDVTVSRTLAVSAFLVVHVMLHVGSRALPC